MLDWDDFRVFLTLARERTLSATARRLKVDQSTVGRRLAALEAAANARLFDRQPDGYVLTAAGEAVLKNVEDIESTAIAVERKLLGQDARVEGRVRLATSDSFAAWFLVPRLRALHERQSGIVIELLTGNQPVSLSRREADLSLRLTKPAQPNLVARCLGRAAWAVYASQSYLRRRGVPEARRRMEGHDVIGFDDELRGTLGARWLGENGAAGRVVLSTNSLLSQGSAVVAGLGVSPLPCLFGDVTPDLRRVFPDVIGHHDIWLVVHPDVRTSARVRLAMEYLTEVITAEERLLAGKRPAGDRPVRGRREPKKGSALQHRGTAQEHERDRPSEQRRHRAHRRLGAEPHE